MWLHESRRRLLNDLAIDGSGLKPDLGDKPRSSGTLALHPISGKPVHGILPRGRHESTTDRCICTFEVGPDLSIDRHGALGLRYVIIRIRLVLP